MSIETKSVHITPIGGNVFADLGFEPEDAAALKAESQRIISEKRAIKEFPIFLSRRESLMLLEMIENPPPRNAKFLQAQARYQKIIKPVSTS